MKLVQSLYEPHVLAARERVRDNATLRALQSPDVEPALLKRFFLQWFSLGVFMTEPVEGWIRRAGEACVRLGMEKVGQSLITHAKHEAGHHTMMIDDTRKLVELWNGRRSTRLDANVLLAQPPTEGVKAYVKLHEDVIASPTPWGQVAIEYEIENLSVVMVPGLLAQVERVLGQETRAALSFLPEHAEIDVGHTALNGKMLEDLLTLRRQDGQSLGEIGARSLDIYMHFLDECMRAAEADVKAQARLRQVA